MQEERIRWLICRHLDQNCTVAETEELQGLIRSHPELGELIERLSNEQSLAEDLRQWEAFRPKEDPDQVIALIRSREAPRRRRRGIRNCIITAAIAVFGGWLVVGLPRKPASAPVMGPDAGSVTAYHQPGRNHALLTLTDGRSIDLDTLSTGHVADQQQISIIKTDSSDLLYAINHPHAKTAPEAPVLYNTLQTPRGGQYAIILPDQTKVWLNNSSALRYPTRFAGPDRRVELTGEAYFEVSRQGAQPFRVVTGDMSIDVLGTRFVVNAYPEDQQTRASLIEGKVIVRTSTLSATLVPGDQVIQYGRDAGDSTRLVHDADMDEAMAWKEGYFHFAHAHLASILFQIGRWYDLEVHLPSNLPDYVYTGEIDRKLPLSQVLTYLSKPDVRLSAHDKKLIVSLGSPDQ